MKIPSTWTTLKSAGAAAALLAFTVLLPVPAEATPATPLTVTTLHSFSVFPNGSAPNALTQGKDGNFYGTTGSGGTNGPFGTVFRMTPNGVVTVLHEFTGGADGANPQAVLALGRDGNYYGTTYDGGHAFGNVFKISTNGSLTNLYAFSGYDGQQPNALLMGSDGNFYGTTINGGTLGGGGTVFRMSTNGTLTNIYTFSDYVGNDNGAYPAGVLIQGSDGYLYGTTSQGGTNGNGTVFKITTNGALTSLYSFTGGSDGLYPQAGLVHGSDGYFYGTTSSGGTNGGGTVFKISSNGTLTSLYSFNQGNDGGYPDAGLVQGSDGNFYGTTQIGGTNDQGNVFKITTNGVLTVLHSFSGPDGADPQAALALGSDGNFYGTATGGGLNLGGLGSGTIFRIAANGAFALLYAFPGVDDGQNANALVQGNDGNFYGTTQYGGTNGQGNVFKFTSNGAFANLYSFTDGNDGGSPSAALVQGSDGNFYGTTQYGGTNYQGNVFQITSGGTLTDFYSFTGATDGATPTAALVRGSDGNFYGTASQGGAYGYGNVFQLTPGGVLHTLYSFTGGNDGADPLAALVQGSDGNFYGTTSRGGTYGTNNAGTVFKITTNGTFASLYSFSGASDGGMPSTTLVQGGDGNFYGTTSEGGASGGQGTVFEITPNGSSATLYSFSGQTDGDNPSGLLAGTDGNFYGATADGGTNYSGAVFEMTRGGALTELYSFTNGVFDGGSPMTALTQGGDGNLYGTTSSGALGGNGGVFRLNGLLLPSPPPTITVQPDSMPDAFAGLSASFSVMATGAAPLSYQWRFNGAILSTGSEFSGTNLPTLTVDPALSKDAGSYSVIVSNSFGSVTSAVAVLSFAPANFVTAYENGTNYLAASNLTSAYNDFASAVAASPTDPEANVYYAMTRLLALPTQSAGSTFLTALGFSASGRNVYDWKSHLLKTADDNNGFPSALNGDVITAYLRNTMLPALVAAQTNLAQITDPGFTMNLPRDVTHLPDVTIDYGDVQMLRAMLNTTELYIYVLNSWNFNATVGSVSNIIAKDKSIEALLTNYPSLLTFATTADKGAAQAAFTNAASLYFAASTFIRNRPAGETFLFNLDVGEYQGELQFRQTLTNLLLSLNGTAQPLPTAPHISISMASFFSDASSPRQLFPQFQSVGSAFIWDTWPDVTLGGVVHGLTQTNLDKALLSKFQAALATPGATLTLISAFPDGGNNANGVIRGKDGNLYGTEQYGGSFYSGSIFKVSMPSGMITTLYSFGSQTNADQGAGVPNGVIQASDGNLYGTAQYGGANGSGTIFRISTAGGPIKTVYAFGMAQDDYASQPSAPLMQGSDGNFYGTTSGNAGTIFSFSPTSMDLSTVYVFDDNDASSPEGPLIQGKDGNLYGVADQTGGYSFGYIYEISTAGANFTDLYDFGSAQDQNGDPLDGSNPTGLVQGTDGKFYGVTFTGGNNDATNGGDGTIFALSVADQGGSLTGTLTTLFSFDQENLDGYFPFGSLVQAANGAFYGATVGGGANERGSVFSFKPGGAATSVVWFAKGIGGFESSDYGIYGYEALPESGLTLGADGNFYGATDKEVYELSVSSGVSSQPPQIATQPAPLNQTVNAGASVTFQITATGTPPLTYQWYFNGGKVSGATTSTLDVTAASNGSYDVIVKNSSGSVTSAVATVTVVVPPSITAQPTLQSVPTNGIATFSVKATGAPLIYQWLFDGQPASGGNISGSATNVLTINPATSIDVGSYSVVVSNSATAAFVTSKVVQLSLIAEKTKPAVAITSPKANSRTNSVLSGTASDSVRVQSVGYWLTNVNNGVTSIQHNLAALTNGSGSSSNWTIQAAILPGTNILAVQSSNYSGLSSPMESVAFFYKEPTAFALTSEGPGKVAGSASVAGDVVPANNALLNIGEGYTLTAQPSNRCLLSNWVSASFTSNTPTLHFIMETGLAITANFSTNFFIGAAGPYNGLFRGSNVTEQTAGMLNNLVLTSNGSYSAKLLLNGGSYSLSGGSFNTSLHASTNVARTAIQGGPVGLSMTLEPASGEVTGSVSNLSSGGWVSGLEAEKAATTTLSDEYTVLLQPGTNSLGKIPPGDGYILVTNYKGSVNLSGALADGSAFSQTVPLGISGDVPVFYGSLYSSTGLLFGWLGLSNSAVEAESSLAWIKPAAHTGLYTNGFTNLLLVSGSSWTNPPAKAPAVPASLAISNTSVSLDFTVSLTNGGVVKTSSLPTNTLTGTIAVKTGLLTITFGNGAGKATTTGYGVMLQNITNGGGYFVTTTNSGVITLTPRPLILPQDQ